MGFNAANAMSGERYIIRFPHLPFVNRCSVDLSGDNECEPSQPKCSDDQWRRGRFPNLAEVACFDTAFHYDLPRVAQQLPIPRRFEAQGVRRYGFHRLSYAYLLGELARVAGPRAANGRVIRAHLGNGASLAAVFEEDMPEIRDWKWENKSNEPPSEFP